MSTRGLSIADILNPIITALVTDPTILGSHVQIFTEDEATSYHKVLIPAINDVNTWERISSKRPSPAPEILPSGAEHHGFGGTDMVIHRFENITWEDYGHVLQATVTYEHGEVIDLAFKIKW